MPTPRIPDFTDRSQAGMSLWFSEMAQRDLLFHPQDRPNDIVDIATGEPTFTQAECVQIDSILDEMLKQFGDSRVCDAAYPVFMQVMGLPAGD